MESDPSSEDGRPLSPLDRNVLFSIPQEAQPLRALAPWWNIGERSYLRCFVFRFAPNVGHSAEPVRFSEANVSVGDISSGVAGWVPTRPRTMPQNVEAI